MGPALDAASPRAACRLAQRARESTDPDELVATRRDSHSYRSGKTQSRSSSGRTCRRPTLIEHAIARGEGVLGARRTADRRHAPAYRPLAERQVLRQRAFERATHRLGRGEPADRSPTASTRFGIASAPIFPNAKRTSLDCYVGADERYRLPLRVYTEFAWHSLFAHHLFITPETARRDFTPEFTVVDAALFKADPARDGTRTRNVHPGELCAPDHPDRRHALRGRNQEVDLHGDELSACRCATTLPMHCSANVGAKGDVAILFGLSGTGKTTLSSDPHRPLIGDDEHGWSADGVFNFEGGCYAKVIRLSPTAEPEIWAATHRFSTVLENVVYDQTRARSTSIRKRKPRTRARPIRSSSFPTSCRRASRPSARRSSC